MAAGRGGRDGRRSGAGLVFIHGVGGRAGDDAGAHAGEGPDRDRDAVGEEAVCHAADDGQEDAEGDVRVHGDRGGECRREGEAAVVEDKGLGVLVPRQCLPCRLVGLAHSIGFLQFQGALI